MSKSYNVDIAQFPDYLAPRDSFAIFTPNSQFPQTPGIFTNNQKSGGTKIMTSSEFSLKSNHKVGIIASIFTTHIPQVFFEFSELSITK